MTAFDRLGEHPLRAYGPASGDRGVVASGGPARVGPVLRGAVDRLRTASIATAQQDAELLLAHLIGVSRLALHLQPGRELEPATLAELEALVARRVRQEPLQYIVGEADFLGFRIAVGPGVFIPRPETEPLAERALVVCPEGSGVAVDLCAGAGAVACALAVHRPVLSVWAAELSAEAAAWARTNVERLGLAARVTVVEGDLFAPLVGLGLAGACDLVVANPPYIAQPALAELPEEVRRFEPELALDGGPAGLSVITRILAEAPAFLRPGAPLVLEIGHAHAEPLRAHLAADPRYGRPTFHQDLLGYERVLEVRVR